MRIRQLALVAHERDRIVEDLQAVFDLGEPFEDPGVSTFGLENAVFAIGDTFLEVVSPAEHDTSAGRFLARRGGDGGYMVILQTEGLAARRETLAEIGVRVVWEIAFDDIATLHLHPRDTGGAILSIDEAHPASSWRWAGPDWEKRQPSRLAQRIVGAEIEAEDPAAMAARWSEITGHAVLDSSGAEEEIPLESSRMRFVPCGPRGEGLTALEIEVEDANEVLSRARRRGLELGDSHLEICGVRIDLRG
jgi:hypothetical protein